MRESSRSQQREGVEAAQYRSTSSVAFMGRRWDCPASTAFRVGGLTTALRGDDARDRASYVCIRRGTAAVSLPLGFL